MSTIGPLFFKKLSKVSQVSFHSAEKKNQREMGKTDAISAVGAIDKVEFGKAVSFIGKRLILADIAST